MSHKEEFSKYYLVLFSGSESHKEVDIVPASWLSYNNDDKTCYCKFMPGPYDKEKFIQIQAMVKSCDEPLPVWPDYPVKIRGRASNFYNAQQRLEILKTELFAYTTDNDESAKKRSMKDEKLFQIRSTTKSSKKLRETLKSAVINFNNKDNKKSSITNLQKGLKSRKKFEEKSTSDSSMSSSRRDTSGESSFCSKKTEKETRRTTKRKKKSPKEVLKKSRKSNDSDSEQKFLSSGFEKSDTLKKNDKSRLFTLPAKSFPTDTIQDNDKGSNDSFNNDAGFLRHSKLLNSKSSDLEGNTIDEAIGRDSSRIFKKLASNHNKSESSLDLSSINSSKKSVGSLKDVSISPTRHTSHMSSRRKSHQRVLSDSSPEIYSGGVNESDEAESKKQPLSQSLAEKAKMNKNPSIPRMIDPLLMITNTTVKNDSKTNELILKYFESISKQVGHLTSQVIINTAELREMKQQLEHKCFCNESDGEVMNETININKENQEAAEKKKKEFDFPLGDKNIFIKFNNKIADTPKYRERLIQKITQIVNKSDSVTKNMTSIIKSYISRQVALQYVPSQLSRRDASRSVFKITPFYDCIVVAMRKKLKSSDDNELSNKELVDAMANTLRNARDWEGHRLLRINKVAETE